jgi:hypothetical protein
VGISCQPSSSLRDSLTDPPTDVWPTSERPHVIGIWIGVNVSAQAWRMGRGPVSGPLRGDRTPGPSHVRAESDLAASSLASLVIAAARRSRLLRVTLSTSSMLSEALSRTPQAA